MYLQPQSRLPPLDAGVNYLSSTLRHRRRGCFLSCDPIPSPALCILVPLLLAGIAVSLFILVAVHNALLLVSLLLLSALVISFLLWNSYNSSRNGALVHFLEQFPLSDLATAMDGQLVKVTGFISCGNLSLDSSYEKVPRCVYTSTLLSEYCGFQLNLSTKYKSFQWNLAYYERFVVDFYITDVKSGIRVLVKAGHNSEVTSLIDESTLVNTTSKNKILSSTLLKWLGERSLSAEARLIRLEEGYVNEGSSLTVMGKLSRNSGILMIVPPAEPISTSCLLPKLLLPTDVNGLILSVPEHLDSMDKSHSSQHTAN